ncbi:MAG: TonB-dependent receptor [Acidobacteria bacterium]|nr:TonB-dependent receptor [Acidobacteriota bacterium]
MRFPTFLLLVTAVLSAAEHRGMVKSGNLPIPGASIAAAKGERKVAATTDEAGRYGLEGLESGPWMVEVEIFGFEKQRREVFVGAEAELPAFDLKLSTGAPVAAAAPAAAFQQLGVNQTASNEILAALNGPSMPETPPAELSANATESFLVTGSLSRGLQAPQDEPFGGGMFGGGLRPETQSVFGMPGGPSGEGPSVERQGGPPMMEGGRMGPGGPGGPGSMSGPGGMRGPGGGPMMGAGRGGPGGGRGGPGGGDRGGRDPRSAGGDRRPPWLAQAGTSRFGNRASRGRETIRGGASFSLRNSALDARSFSLTGQTLPKPSYAQSRFSLMAGGPLHIPKLLQDDKTFYFVNYSGSRSRNPFDSVSTLPSALERAGDFSQSVIQGPVSIFDPSGRLPFAGNLVPASRFNSASRGLVAFLPLPNLPGQVRNYQILTSNPQNSDSVGVRLNRGFGRRDRFALGYNLQRRAGESTQLYGFRDSSSGRGQSADLSWTRTLHRGLVSTLRSSFSRNRSQALPFFANGPDVAAQLGIAGASGNPLSYGPPNLSFTNFGGLSDGSPSQRSDQTLSLNEGLLYSRGKHNMRFGFEIRRTQSNSVSDQNGRGTFTFTGLSTSALDERGQPLAATGFDFADFVLGLPQSSSVRFGGSDVYFRGAAYNLFLQDDFRVRPNFSVNLGLRYEFLPPLREKYNRMVNLDIAPGFTGVAVVLPETAGPYTGVFPAGLVDPDRNNLAPRIGIAWKPVPKRPLQVRGGYGVYFNGSVYNQAANRMAQQPPFSKSASLVTSLARTLTLQNGFASAPSTQITNTFAIDRGYRAGYAQTWNLSLQQELPGSLVAELGYLGTKGTRLDIQRQPNRAAPGSPLTAEQRRQIGNATGFTYDSSEGNSVYHAGQLRLSRRFRRGVSVNALYTYGKSIDNVSTFGGGGAVVVQDDKNLRAERGLSSFDQRHTLNLSCMLTSPYGEGSARAATHTFAGRLLASWSLMGGLTFRSGSPFTATVLGNRADSGGTGTVGSSRADSTGLPVLAGTGFFNPLAFTLPPAGRYGNAARNTIPGLGQGSMNASLGRGISLGERRRLDIRVESGNLLNQVSFTRVGTTVNSSSYGLATAAGNMRSVNVNLRLRF